MAAPGRQVEVKACRHGIVPLTIIACGTHEILESHRTVGQVCKRQPDVALALIGSIIHRHQQPFLTRTLPDKSQEAIPSPVAIPGWNAFEQLPATVAHGWQSQYRYQAVIELLDLFVQWLEWRPHQMRRDALLSPLELTLV